MPDEVIAALRRAVEGLPTDVALRLHLAEVELASGLHDDAVATVAEALRLEPGNAQARGLMARAISSAPSMDDVTALPVPVASDHERVRDDASDPGDLAPSHPEPDSPGFDWDAAEDDLATEVQPAFVDASRPDRPVWSTERPGITLADVGGMDEVKEQLTASFLAPLANPELRRLYGTSLRGGLLMYGPPGCGKTFVARAVAGELGAAFCSVGVADVLDKWLGSSERNIHEAFVQARLAAPCVVFLDELDTLGQRRSAADAVMTGVINQLLTELDGFADANDGVFVLAATNQPWQVDPALRRPGRFDRTVLVLPPDQKARAAIFGHQLRQRPVEGVDVAALAARTEGLTGADIAQVCKTAAERALLDSVRTGQARTIGMGDLLAAVDQTRPSIGPWLDTARNVVMFGEDDGTFAQLRRYLKKARRL